MSKSKAKPALSAVPQPVERDIRICFAIAFFHTEADAEAFAAANPGSYNGGYFHGVRTGRDKSWDKADPSGLKLYAVTY